jgi:hypothetical protein
LAGIDLLRSIAMPIGKQIVIIVLLIVGVVLLLLGATWKHWHSPQMMWSKEQATEYTSAWLALKGAATSGLRGADPKDPKFIAAQERYNAIKTKLDRAIAFNDNTGTALVAVGAVIIVICGWLLWSQRQSSNE